ncbi:MULTISPECIES: DUF6221 family protein [unclassified Streptomyces]|uniref:DUF6221 family protein n=1 Tax=unclassified Streptomyces TaxID=2593676 RepID=UPI003865111A
MRPVQGHCSALRCTAPDDAETHPTSPRPIRGRPPGFGAEAYKQRNAVERCINPLELARPGHTMRQTRDRVPGPTPPCRHPHLDTCCVLAQSYATHPAYRREWRP